MNLQGDKKNALVKLLAKITILLSILFFVLILVLILHPDYSIIRISIFLLLILLIYLGFFWHQRRFLGLFWGLRRGLERWYSWV